MSEHEETLILVVVFEGRIEKHRVTRTVFEMCVAWAKEKMACMAAQAFEDTDEDRFSLFGKHLLGVFGEGTDDWQTHPLASRSAKIVFANTEISIKMRDEMFEKLLVHTLSASDPQRWGKCLNGTDFAGRPFVLNIEQLCSISRVPKSDSDVDLL